MLVAVAAGVLLLLIADLWNLLLEIEVGGLESFSEFAVTSSWTVMSATCLIGGLLFCWRWSAYTLISRRRPAL